MPINIGVSFEHKFAENWRASFPNSLCFKLQNQMSGYRLSNNLADFICYDGERMYVLDCKTHKGGTFPFDAFPQYGRLISLKTIPNLITGIILWLYEKDRVYFIPTYTIEKLKKDGKKSINLKTVDRAVYYLVEIPSVKLRTFMNSNYSILQYVPDYLTYSQGENKE